MKYDRMNPKLSDLIQRLHKYSIINYGIEAYPLSSAEAKLLVDTIEIWCNDPYHNLRSVSQLIYIACPTCGYEKKEKI